MIAALETAEASWIWMTKMHAAEGGGKQEDGSTFWPGAAIAVTETSPGDGNINDNVKKCLFFKGNVAAD